MRALQTLTCVMVIAAISYYFIGEYRAYADRQAAEQARVQRIIHSNTKGRAADLARAGTCTSLATRLVDNAGYVSESDRADARLCASYAPLGAYERHTFDRFAAQLAE
jgi:hypothetical protein